jgi:hypothetical protein
MPIGLPETYKKIERQHSDCVRDLGGASIVRLVNSKGLFFELGHQRQGLWLPGFARGMYGLAIGSPERQELITQPAALHHAAYINYTKYEPGKLGPEEVTRMLSPGELALKVQAIVGRSRLLTAEQVDAYAARVSDAGQNAATTLGQMLYNQPGAGAYVAL